MTCECSEDGFTLIEALVALAVVGLTLSGLFAAMRTASLIERQGHALASAEGARRAVDNGLQGILHGEGPFGSAGGLVLTGDREGFTFPCGVGVCEARLQKGGRATLHLKSGAEARAVDLPRLAGPLSKLHFVFLGSRTQSDHWPPDNPTDWQRLRAIELADGAGAPLSVARIWFEGDSRQTAVAAPIPSAGEGR